ncbi:geraniol 8-hydroxylase-like [Diospyros lotus]|uniref:geraniol 8-hydroxylase-like n=1 Tax=Diospyros lotus TaxID=55363 RepID=UPI00224E898D|nr:geraniol 8-hydroxylase-like [Diospyros lotus]
MDLYVLLLSIFLFGFFFRLLLRRSPAKTLPPGPAGLPIIGSLHLLGERPNQSLAKLAKVHGPLFTLRLGSITTVVASSAEVAKEILQKHDQTFSNRPMPDTVSSQPNPESTLAWSPGDHRWRNRRRVCNTQMFNGQKLDQLQHLRHKKAQELVHLIKKRALSGNVVEIGRVAFATTLNLISNTVFSKDMVDPESESTHEFKNLVWILMEGAGKPNFSDFFPALRRFDLQGLRRHVKPAYSRLHEIFDEIIDLRLKAKASDVANSTRTGDFLDVLLDQCEQDGSDFNRQTIRPLILELFIAGTDTSAITTEWAMAELLHNPEILKKARKEIIETIPSHQLVQESDIDRLPYLQAIVNETLRLHPAGPLLLPYIATDDVELLGFVVPKNTQLLVNAWAIGRDPKHWDQPLLFLPERFLNSGLDYKGRNFEYIPFGAGRRICPGMPLAVRMVHLMLASVLQAFDWKLPEGTTPENMDMEEQFGITLKKAVPLRAIPVLESLV